ncbi:aldehyde dehydrogenase [Citricoccus sp. SGAir0253]|uniref:aldehyde dehydrogenase family protein n=1 Tax=Citricoccus sp. SGAir0253 TaxID=2567881 RepID=UPI0010CD4B99|nr:aldehyde dehydrogenase family protein [Citricoccus sp. SGAir0253]QCU77195.1 aldehyde dehydrogenase [Citricoccus sp. SGAir0253]
MTTTATAPAEITVLSPHDGSVVGTLPCAGEDEVRAAVATARSTARDWARTSPEERGRILRAAADALAEHAQELAELNTRETGKLAGEALGGVMAGVGTLHQYAELGPVHRGRSLRGSALAADWTVAEPRGVVAAITPWNDPVAVAAGLLGAAIVTGNTVVHKPSERCPHTGARLGEILAAALPEGVLVTVTGGPETGRLVTSSPDVDMVAHVGSTETGQAIARAALETGAHVIRENGGNDPLVVDEDVDPAWAAEQAAIGAFTNAGQICTSVERVYVHRAIAEPFLAALTAEAERRSADPELLAPLVDRRLRETVHGHVTEAVAAGGTVLAGGEVPAGEGSAYPATVLRDCTQEMTVMREETFGPVAPVCVVDGFEEGLRLAAEGRYGLAATVLTGSIAHAQQAVAELGVGTLKVNNVFGGAPGGAAQPRRDSGSGFGYGPELLDEMTEVKVVHVEMPPAR